MAIHHRPDQGHRQRTPISDIRVNDDIGWRDTLVVDYRTQKARSLLQCSFGLGLRERTRDGWIARPTECSESLKGLRLPGDSVPLFVIFRDGLDLGSSKVPEIGRSGLPRRWEPANTSSAQWARTCLTSPIPSGRDHTDNSEPARLLVFLLPLRISIRSFDCDVMMWNSPGSIRAYLTARSPAEQRKEET